MALSGSIKLTVAIGLSGSTDLGSQADAQAISQTITLTDGSGANQASQVWGDTRSLAASTSEELDLNGSLTNGLGATVSFTRIVAIIIKSASTNGDTITVGGASSNAWEPWAGATGDEIKIRPGGFLALAAPDATGLAVTASTADLLKILNDDSGAAASYDILLIGSEA